MAAFPGPAGPGAPEKVPSAPDEDIRSSANTLSLKGPPATGGPLGGTTTGTATGRAVSQLLRPGPGAFRQVEERITGKQGEGGETRTVTRTSPAERARQQSVRSLRAGGPRGTGFGGKGTNPDTGLTEAVGGTPKSLRTRGSVASGGTAGGAAGAGQPSFAVGGNFRSGVIGAGLFLDTTGLSAIDKLNPRG